ncbi:M20 metallopeptidase family protein [Pseudobacillus badius]|uniref:M20 metallopeptidase family protein n=1 Tax=Bacillus badius TaxID=1455 RepID=UPI0007B36E96|nr:amidohydrolase [Bacillus badius]KZR60058.1 hypothetical protein A3781_07600 [Bacillus badius]
MKIEAELTNWIVEQRRYLHQNPELSHQEKRTKMYIKERLNEMGIETYSLTGKDVIGIMKGDYDGKVIGIRADMDALPIKEETGLPFASTKPNVMHACGHDGHMAILLGIAKDLSHKKDKIHGTVLFIFQHAEEALPGGAIELVDKNLLNGIDAMFGYHLWQPLELGFIGIHQGPAMAGVDRFCFTIYGKGGHGSMPHQTVDPTVVISNIITQMQTIVSRSLDSKDQAVVSIGELHSGSNYNVIPHTAYASGAVRYFDNEVSKLIRKRVEAIIKGVCDSFGASFDLSYEQGDPPLLNDKQLTAFIQKKAINLFGEERVVQMNPIMGSEDFAHYSASIPATYTFIGIGKPSHPYGHHHPKFDIDEAMLSAGVELFTNSVLDYLKEEADKNENPFN